MSKDRTAMRIGIIGMCLAIIAFVATESARADTKEDVILISALCAGSNSLVATQSEGAFAEVLFEEARFWADFTRQWIGDDAKANKILESVVIKLRNHYESGGMTWDDMVSMAQECTNVIKPELVEILSE